jgi:hypothetical protein
MEQDKPASSASRRSCAGSPPSTCLTSHTHPQLRPRRSAALGDRSAAEEVPVQIRSARRLCKKKPRRRRVLRVPSFTETEPTSTRNIERGGLVAGPVRRPRLFRGTRLRLAPPPGPRTGCASGSASAAQEQGCGDLRSGRCDGRRRRARIRRRRGQGVLSGRGAALSRQWPNKWWPAGEWRRRQKWARSTNRQWTGTCGP